MWLAGQQPGRSQRRIFEDRDKKKHMDASMRMGTKPWIFVTEVNACQTSHHEKSYRKARAMDVSESLYPGTPVFACTIGQ